MTETAAYEDVVGRYLRFWNADSDGERRRLAAETFTDDVEYSAPIGVLTGPDALTDTGRQFIEHFGTITFRARETPEGHHDRARLRWEIRLGDDRTFATGTDVITIAGDGRVRSVTAFLDQAPEGFDPHAHH